MLIKLKDGGYLFSDDDSNENPLKYLIKLFIIFK